MEKRISFSRGMTRMLLSLIAQVALFSAFPLYFTFLDPLIRRASFFIYIALVLLIGGFFGNVYSLPITETINVSGGNLCYGAFMMSSVLFVLVERDAFILRHLVRLVVLVDLFNILFSTLVSHLLSDPVVINPHNTSANLFEVSIPFIILGGVLIITELLLLLFCFEKIKSRHWPDWLTAAIYILCFVITLCLDGILFPLIALGFSDLAIEIVIGGLPGKALMSALYAIPLWGFVLIKRQTFRQFLHTEPFKWSLLLTTSQKLMQELSEKEYGLKQADTVFQHVKEGLAIIDSDGTVLRTNPAFTKLLNLSQGSAIAGQDISQWVHPVDTNWADIRTNNNWKGEVVFGLNRTPGLLTISATVGDQIDQGDTFVYSLVNIDELKQTQDRLAYLARHDVLTGVANRRLLDEHLSYLKQHNACLIIVDLDHFKDVNDSYGHGAGDYVLKEVSQRIIQTLTDTEYGDTVLSRTGGDEFAILMDNVSNNIIRQLVENIRLALTPVLTLPQGSLIYVSATIGVSTQQLGENRDLLQEADAALYSAKRQQRGSVGFYEERLTNISQRKLMLSSKLKAALESNSLTVLYQPQYSADNGHIVGVEALSRWQDDELGWVSPAEFIPIAEEMGMIDTLGEWVLREACIQANKWSQQSESCRLKVSVNVSAHQLRFGRFVDTLKKILDETQLTPDILQLELTESAFIEREQEVIPQLSAIKAMGVSLAIDDFGTGYSSLSYIASLPWDTLKIDRSFIDKLPEDEMQQKMADTIIKLANNMNLEIVVEGVETKAQLDCLAEMGCDVIQGFYYSTAIPANEIKLS